MPGLDREFKASLGSIARLYLKIKEKEEGGGRRGRKETSPEILMTSALGNCGCLPGLHLAGARPETVESQLIYRAGPIAGPAFPASGISLSLSAYHRENSETLQERSANCERSDEKELARHPPPRCAAWPASLNCPHQEGGGPFGMRSGRQP